MSWKEASPGHFERPLDGIELWYRALGSGGAQLNREHWSVTAVAQIHLHLPADEHAVALREAWKTLRYDHPQISCTVQGYMNVYEVPDETAIETWLKDTFITAPSQTANSLFSTFTPSASAVMYYLPQVSEVVIHFSHSRMDGIGALHLLHQFFKALVEPRSITFGAESRNLSPGIYEATSFPTEITPEIAEAVAKMLTEFTGNLPSLGLPTIASNQLPGPSQRRELRFSTQSTCTVMKACKDRGISVTAAVHAALINATHQLAPPELAAKKYTSWCVFDLRRYCHPPFNSAAHPVAVYHAALIASMTPSSFLTNASKLQAIYKRSWDPSHSDLLGLIDPFTKGAIAMLSQPPPPNVPPPADPLLSSLGVVDRYIHSTYGDKLEVKGFWLATEMLTRQVEVHVWTFQGRLTLSACFNESFYEGSFVQIFLSKIQEILYKELEIEC